MGAPAPREELVRCSLSGPGGWDTLVTGNSRRIWVSRGGPRWEGPAGGVALGAVSMTPGSSALESSSWRRVPRPRLCRAGAASRPTPRKALPSCRHFLERRGHEVMKSLADIQRRPWFLQVQRRRLGAAGQLVLGGPRRVGRTPHPEQALQKSWGVRGWCGTSRPHGEPITREREDEALLEAPGADNGGSVRARAQDPKGRRAGKSSVECV